METDNIDTLVESIGQLVLMQNEDNDLKAAELYRAMFATAIFPKAFQEIAQKCYMEQMDAFAKLFEDPQFYERVMKEMAEAMYLRFRNGK